jgi:Ca-activated chloride channel family protein
MNQPPLTKTRALLTSALVLSLAAVVSVALKPRPAVGQGGAVIAEGGGVKVEARSSHVALAERGTELFAEYNVTLEGGLEVPHHVSLALVLDRSGSMSGQKLLDARRAAHRMVDLLRDGDELALISFGSDVSGGARRTLDAATRARLHEEIDAIEAAGSTFLSGGIEAGRAALMDATGARRLVVVSDGQPTIGLADEASLAALVSRVHEGLITVTALGVGTDYDGLLMQHLAEAGGGMYGYLKDASALEEVLGQEVTAARAAIARNVEIGRAHV